MKEKTYRRMTKKRPMRGLKLFKHKYFNKQRFYSLLAKIKLVREVKSYSLTPYTTNDLLGKITILDENITSDRGTFNLSYKAEAQFRDDQWYYESYRGKRLHTFIDSQTYHIRVEARSECLSFEVKIDPFTTGVASRTAPYVFRHPFKRVSSLTEQPTDTATITRHLCNLLNARLSMTVGIDVHCEKDINEAVRILVSEVRRELTDYIQNHPEEINERLTGVKYDGEFCTKEGKRLLPNCVCGKCSRPVFESSVEGYTAQCLFCDEDLYTFEVKKIDPEMYKDIYEISKTALYKILSE